MSLVRGGVCVCTPSNTPLVLRSWSPASPTARRPVSDAGGRRQLAPMRPRPPSGRRTRPLGPLCPGAGPESPEGPQDHGPTLAPHRNSLRIGTTLLRHVGVMPSGIQGWTSPFLDGPPIPCQDLWMEPSEMLMLSPRVETLWGRDGGRCHGGRRRAPAARITALPPGDAVAAAVELDRRSVRAPALDGALAARVPGRPPLPPSSPFGKVVGGLPLRGGCTEAWGIRHTIFNNN